MCLLLGLALGWGGTTLLGQTKVADAKVFVVVSGKQTASDMSAVSSYADSQMSSYETAATSPLVLDPVIDKLKLDTTAVKLAEHVTVTASTNSFVLDIQVENSSADTAVAVANAIADQMGTAIKELTPEDKLGVKPLASVTITKASAVDVASSSSMARNVIGLGILGLLLGVALALLMEGMSSSSSAPRRSGDARESANGDGGTV